MAEVRWSDEALADLDRIRTYIECFDAAAAERLAGRLVKAAFSLSDFPNRGRAVADGRRALSSVRPYVIFYDVVGSRVVVAAIRHGAQLRDPA